MVLGEAHDGRCRPRSSLVALDDTKFPQLSADCSLSDALGDAKEAERAIKLGGTCRDLLDL